MEDNSKLFVFDKKEVILIFVFIVLIAITSFTLGVRFGKQLSLKKDDYGQSEQNMINLKSVEEERVESITNPESDKSTFESTLEEKEGNNELDTEARLREEMEKLAKEPVKEIDPVVEEQPAAKPTADSPQAMKETEEDIYKPKGNLVGKYTIQLAAFSTKDEAQSFADGFIISGYDAIINDVVIPGKGTWYRVSVGIFDNLNEAKAYLEKEKAFFQGKDYLINKLE